MLLQEPPHSSYDLHFVLAGVPVRVHPYFWLASLALMLSTMDGLRNFQWQVAAIWLAVLFVSILFHEFGHALAYRRYGYEPRIVLHWLGGLASADMTYATRPPSGKRKMFISMAGPLAGFLLAAVVVGLLYATGKRLTFLNWQIGRGEAFDATSTGRNLHVMVYSLLFVNILWGLVNLLPVYPLDGGQIAREGLDMRYGAGGILGSLKLSMVVGILAGLGFLLGMGFRDGLFPGLLFASLAFNNYREMRLLMDQGGYDDDEGESWRRGRSDHDE